MASAFFNPCISMSVAQLPPPVRAGEDQATACSHKRGLLLPWPVTGHTNIVATW